MLCQLKVKRKQLIENLKKKEKELDKRQFVINDRSIVNSKEKKRKEKKMIRIIHKCQEKNKALDEIQNQTKQSTLLIDLLFHGFLFQFFLPCAH